MTDNSIPLFPPPMLEQDYTFYAIPWLSAALLGLAIPTGPKNPHNKGTNYKN